MSTRAPSPLATESPAPHLSRWSFGLALALTLAVFFLLHPLWEPLDMAAMDRNIIWSYAPIPLLVAVLLRVERKLRWSTWLLETLRLTFVKFAITFLFANLAWTFITPPGPPASSQAPGAPGATAIGATPSGGDVPSGGSTGRFEVQPAPTATPIDASRTGVLAGIVRDAAGAPRAGALVAVTGGLEPFVFAPRPEGVVLTHAGQGLSPRSAIVQVYERLVLRSATQDLHTLRALDERGRQLFNTPLRPGTDHSLMFERALGRLRLGCTVHGQSEAGAEVTIVANPFAAWTGDDGRFRFESVPCGRLQLTANASSGQPVSLEVSLEPGQALDGLTLTLP